MRDPKDVSQVTPPSEAGFSLLEILIAVMILVLMGGVVMTNLFPAFFKAKRDKAELDIQNIAQAVKQWQLRDKRNRLPEQSEFPQCLTQPGENGEEPPIEADRLEGGKLLDPWGFEYVYIKHSGSKFEIISYGADGMQGGEKDDADISSIKNDSGGGGGGRPR
jgi:general secretion pathway protein G